MQLTSVLAGEAKRGDKDLSKHIGAKCVDTVYQIPRVAEESGHLLSHSSSSPVLVPPVQPVQQVELEVQVIGLGP